jgi:hypothetical protein
MAITPAELNMLYDPAHVERVALDHLRARFPAFHRTIPDDNIVLHLAAAAAWGNASIEERANRALKALERALVLFGQAAQAAMYASGMQQSALAKGLATQGKKSWGELSMGQTTQLVIAALEDLRAPAGTWAATEVALGFIGIRARVERALHGATEPRLGGTTAPKFLNSLVDAIAGGAHVARLSDQPHESKTQSSSLSPTAAFFAPHFPQTQAKISFKDLFQDAVIPYRNAEAHDASEKTALSRSSLRTDKRIARLLAASVVHVTTAVLDALFDASDQQGVWSWSVLEVQEIESGPQGNFRVTGPTAVVVHPLGTFISWPLGSPTLELAIKSKDLLVVRRNDGNITPVGLVFPVLVPESPEIRWNRERDGIRALLSTAASGLFAYSGANANVGEAGTDPSASEAKTPSTIAEQLQTLLRQKLALEDSLDGRSSTVADHIKTMWEEILKSNWPAMAPGIFDCDDSIMTTGLFAVSIGGFCKSQSGAQTAGVRDGGIDGFNALGLSLAFAFLQAAQRNGVVVKLGEPEAPADAIWVVPSEDDDARLVVSAFCASLPASGGIEGLPKLYLRSGTGSQESLSLYDLVRLASAAQLVEACVPKHTESDATTATSAAPDALLTADEAPVSLTVAGHEIGLNPKRMTPAALIDQLNLLEPGVRKAIVQALAAVTTAGQDWRYHAIGTRRDLYVVLSAEKAGGGGLFHHGMKPFSSPSLPLRSPDGPLVYFEQSIAAEVFLEKLRDALKAGDEELAQPSRLGEIDAPLSIGGIRDALDTAAPIVAFEDLKGLLPKTSVATEGTPPVGSIAVRLPGAWISGLVVSKFLRNLVEYGTLHGWAPLMPQALPYRVGRKRCLVSVTGKHLDGAEFRNWEVAEYAELLSERSGGTLAAEHAGAPETVKVEGDWGRTYALVVARKLCTSASVEVLEATDAYGVVDDDLGQPSEEHAVDPLTDAARTEAKDAIPTLDSPMA